MFREKRPFPSVRSVGLSEYMNSAPNRCVSLKFNIEDFFDNLTINNKFCNFRTKIWRILHENKSTFVFWAAVRTIL